MGIITCSDPGEMYLWAAWLLIIAFGMCLIAVAEALDHHLMGWVCCFAVLAVGCVVLTLTVVGWWVAWLRAGVTLPDD